MAKQANKKTTRIREKSITYDLSLPIYGIDEKEESQINLPKEIFNQKINKKLLAQYVRVYLTNQKPIGGSTKTRGEVAGSTRKIYRQKGTGRARHGDIKAPIFVGGGIAHGPKPRFLTLKLNKKQKKMALFLALSLKFKENKIIVLSDKVLETESKTKTLVKLLKNFVDEKKPSFLLVLPSGTNDNILKAARNISYLDIVNVANLNPYLILKYKKILFLPKTIDELNKIFFKK